jgi:hypothetical protein
MLIRVFIIVVLFSSLLYENDPNVQKEEVPAQKEEK